MGTHSKREVLEIVYLKWMRKVFFYLYDPFLQNKKVYILLKTINTDLYNYTITYTTDNG